MNTTGARILITDTGNHRIFEEYVDPEEMSMGLPGMAQAVEAMRETLPSRPRRTPRQRWEAMLQHVLPDMLRAYRIHGQMPEWPRSVQETLQFIADRDHDPTLVAKGGVEQVIRQGKAITTYLAETGQRQQALQDAKKVTLDWAGH